MPTRWTRTHLRKAALAGRLATGAALLLAIGVVLIPLPEPQGPVIKPLEPVPPANQASDTEQRPIDLVALADSLRNIAPRPEPKTPDKPQIAEQDNQETPDTTAQPLTRATLNWRYLGRIVEPKRNVALIDVGGRQRLLGEGQTFQDPEMGEVTIESVDKEELVIALSDRTERIQLASGNATVGTFTAAPAPTPTATRNVPVNPRLRAAVEAGADREKAEEAERRRQRLEELRDARRREIQQAQEDEYPR